MSLQKFWFKFEVNLSDSPPAGILMGCGVTAVSLEDAMSLLSERIFKNTKIPQIKEQVKDVDISTLDQNHVIPNMGNSLLRGIWFPLGYS